MEIKDIKDLMSQFDTSSLREFSYSNHSDQLTFSKNELTREKPNTIAETSTIEARPSSPAETAVLAPAGQETEETIVEEQAEGDVVESPLVGVAYLASAPDKAAFVSVGDTVKKGQTLLIIEAMKVMNEVPAPQDGVVTEILVANEEVVEFGQGLVRIK
ncbi:acetyl-CoA carboxylase biotin carboxyl carrier protein [Streptococcus macacae]|uniref:Biotin carboxyl carrier protein of acetyl-CoA carboxylase n=1 Tax=Streptococcus macacae NCTC 11558 TaxID=764298 RepID=G5JY54_9STRE|nr:acetyl-CoA carboxylase biotin carboxyl carrier protein [Streptococcus macacae]EHJ53049.1 acetyl-CoA carboxylase, biotin carboxyl carrier protein [Streptococcus macacae NCTC 11558]SUN77969.1 acetyl-CoA carboxylase biotin carboxyl carrier protein subunit [Streptococcus macacae NCTC 11558]